MARHKNPRSASLPPAPEAARRRTRRHFLGVFIGLVLGLGLAAGVAYFVTKANSPYASSREGHA